VSKAIDKAAGAERERIKYKGGIASGQGNYGGNGSIHDGTKVGNKAKTHQAQQWQGWGTALKPAHEPIVVARKPLIGTVAENVLEHGVGGLNIDGCRIGTREHAPQITGAKKTGNTYGVIDSEGGKVLDQGRWPSNIIFDEQAAKLLDEQSGTSKSPTGIITQGGKSGGGYDIGTSDGTRNTKFQGHGDRGGASRFFYCAKASKRDRNDGLEGFEKKEKRYMATKNGTGETSKGMEQFTSDPMANFHPTVKPTSLMRYLVRLVTPPNGLVLDPFMGSGSTGKACALEHFDFVGIELNAEYIKICEARIENALQDKEQQQELF
jgi:site-specific DNA-methyltransferase (adenine-specific)